VNVFGISDKLLEIYTNQRIRSTSFSSTIKHDYRAIYDEIIDYIIKSQSHTNVLSFGSSDGGYPALYNACRFNTKVLIANTQPYPEQHSPRWEAFCKAVKDTDDKDAVKDFMPIETAIATFGAPKQTVFYCNLNDNYAFIKSAIQFATFAKKAKLDNIEVIFFISSEPDRPGKDAHSTYMPDGVDVVQLCGADGI
jgi:hypothetical protein